MNVVLIRHLTPLIEPGICYGRLDVPPDPVAFQQASALAAHPALRGVAQIWTSPSRRCRVLAGTIAATLAVPLTVDSRLSELDFGEWEGRRWDDVERNLLDLWAATPLTFAPPGGESGAALIERVRDFCDGLSGDKDCAIVSHGGPLKVLAALLGETPVDLLAAAPAFGSVRTISTAGHRVIPAP